MSFVRIFAITIIFFFVGIVLLFLYFTFGGEDARPLVGIVAGDAMAVFLIWFLIEEGLLGPLQNIKEAMKKVGKGEFDVKIKKGFLKEMREFGDSVEGMIGQIQRDREEIEDAKTTLEIRIQARTKELQELAEGLEEKVKARTKELEEKIQELEHFQRLTSEARAQAEEEKEKTFAIIKNLSDGLLVFDEKGTLTVMNPAAERLIGITEKSIGREAKALWKMPELKPLFAVLGEGLQEMSRKEVFLENASTVEVSVVPIRIGKSRIGRVLVIHDVTREKRVENAKTEFVSLAAHQLRTPLSAVKWTLHMLLEGDLGEVSQEQRDFLLRTHQANERMIALVNDLLDVARVEEGTYVYQPKPVHIEETIKPVVQSYQEQADREHITLEAKFPQKESPKVLMDAEKISLVVQNLLQNAFRYTKSGGKVVLSAEYDAKNVKIIVEDTGIGISKVEKERLFEKFFRGKEARKLVTEGSGLGLYLVKNIIEAHGGEVGITSKENKGTTAWFSLPIQKST